MTHIEVSSGLNDAITGSGKATGYGSSVGAQRRVVLTVGQTEITVYVHGEDETRALFRALAGAAGGLLATLPDEPRLAERDESAAAAAVEGERWPSAAEVSGEVYAPSCGYGGCTPDKPCSACQSLAGAQGAGTQGGER